jgi:hypothetical protein
VPNVKLYQLPGLTCGNVAVSTAPPLPLYGEYADDENVCGMSFRYAPALKTSYIPPFRNMYWSERPTFSP